MNKAIAEIWHGRKDCSVILSQHLHLLDLLRAWWKAARPQGWLFAGRDPTQPMTTRQLNRACHAAARWRRSASGPAAHSRHSFRPFEGRPD
ncbi:hypothetical protein [Bradyrhizobium sp. WSM1743]|uniref:hypothetical protein n=1 Tax=Bradyrhizobium sp. WSM1743 TaxID=318996 RepID=UPI0003F79E5D|nr:hypothetical protein [Bradyrhizobium sp. WSM1743]